MLSRPNIYEADFKGFFDNVEITGINKVLREELKLPEQEINFIENLNKSQVKLGKEDKLDEFKTRQFEYIRKCLSEDRAPEGPY
jgi:DNA repair photolyase